MEYRRDIDGLRAVAVIPVILYHAKFPGFDGGFIGVDVFFVISGFLITSILIAEVGRAEFSIIDFYERRARRILPALIFLLVVCIPIASAVLLPRDFADFARSLMAVLLFASNFYFLLTGDYFDGTGELDPLLHTWSLAVEEQFYIFFPWVIVFCFRWHRLALPYVVAIAALLSLVGSEVVLADHPSLSFYLLPTRAWELLAGAYIAIPAVQGRLAQVSPAWRQAGTIAGISLILFSVSLFSEDTPFPGMSALLPVSGTVLLIALGSKPTLVGRFLSLGPLVGVGLVSYSAYLWHQPVFAFARYHFVAEPPLVVMVGLSVLSLGIAFVSWQLVEAPFRSRQRFSRAQLFRLAGFASIVLFSVGVAGHSTRGFQKHYLGSRTSNYERDLVSLVDYNSSSEFKNSVRLGECFYTARTGSFESFDRRSCLATASARPNILVLGDSHAAHLYHGLVTEFPAVNFLQATASGCRPVTAYAGERRCTDLMKYVFEEFLPRRSVEGVVLAGQWSEGDLGVLEETVQYASRFADAVYVIGPTVEYTNAVPAILLKLDRSVSSIEADSIFVVQNRFELSATMETLFARGPARFVSVTDALCTEQVCSLKDDRGDVINWDYSHFTSEGSVYVVRRLKQSGRLSFGPGR